MRSFRFPRSTICLMLIILAGVLVAIEKGRNLSVQLSSGRDVPDSWSALPGVLLMALALMCAAGAIGYAALFLLRKTGTQRFPNIHGRPGSR